MSCPSTPIFVPSCSSTPSPPLNSPDEHTSTGPDVDENVAMMHAIRVHHAHGRMSPSAIALTQAQIQQNEMEDTREYHDEWIDQLSNAKGAARSHTAMHGAMIGHWATTFNTSVSDLLQNFANTPSITIPMLANFPPPPHISPIALPILEYPRCSTTRMITIGRSS